MGRGSTWAIKQVWENLLFLHWELEPGGLVPLLPDELVVDSYHGKAWLTVLSFAVTHQRFRLLPELPFLNRYLELNVRTYVKHQGVPGVYFFSVEVDNPLVALGAKAASLPYRIARMNLSKCRNEILFCSKRAFRGESGLSVSYEPEMKHPAVALEPGSLDRWLLERYVLFNKWGPFMLRGDIRHEQWEVRPAKVSIGSSPVEPFKLGPVPELVHFVSKKQAFILPLKIVRPGK